jgi:hypothetical protein
LYIWRRTVSGLVASKMAERLDLLERVMAEAWQRRGLPGNPRIPEPHLQSKVDVYRQWAWMALDAGAVQTARHYAAKCWLQQPWHPQSWRLALCAVRGTSATPH